MQIKPNVATAAANSAKPVSAAQQKVAAQAANTAAKAAPADKVSISPEALALQNADQSKV